MLNEKLPFEMGMKWPRVVRPIQTHLRRLHWMNSDTFDLSNALFIRIDSQQPLKICTSFNKMKCWFFNEYWTFTEKILKVKCIPTPQWPIQYRFWIEFNVYFLLNFNLNIFSHASNLNLNSFHHKDLYRAHSAI